MPLSMVTVTGGASGWSNPDGTVPGGTVVFQPVQPATGGGYILAAGAVTVPLANGNISKQLANNSQITSLQYLVTEQIVGATNPAPYVVTPTGTALDLSTAPRGTVGPATPLYVLASALATMVLNVKDYGARGDGVTNDTAAIQSALDAAYAAGGGVVFMPTATYIIDPNPGLQVKTNVTLRGSGEGSIIKLKNGSIRNDNIVKSESWTNVTLENFTIDGNRTSQAGTPGAYTYTQYGVYIGGTTNSIVRNVFVKGTTGVGIHVYNGQGVLVEGCRSTDNNYHGYEFEQDTNCHLVGSRGYTNRLHGLLVSPGEVSGTGSKGNHITACSFDGNSQYGIGTNAANADISAWLNEGDTFTNNSITGNTQYGVNFYKQDKHVFNSNYVARNGYFGLYAFQSSNNSIQGNTFVNNSQTANGAYDEIMVEGNSSGHASANSNVSGNTFVIAGAIKARWAINEGTAGDGPNVLIGNTIPAAGTAGRINSLNTTTIVNDYYLGNSVVQGSSLPTGRGGMDAPFAGVTRWYAPAAGQLVAASGNFDFYSGGTGALTVTPTGITVNGSGTAVTPNFRITTSQTPATATAAGTAGQIAWDAGFIYVCVATNTWKRVAIAAW